MSRNQDRHRWFMMIQNNLLILIMMSVFAWIWYSFFSYLIPLPFWLRGNLLLFALYGVLFYLSQRFYQNNSLAYQRTSDIIYGNLVALLLTNGFTYLQVSLIARSFLNLNGFFIMTAIQGGWIIFWFVLIKTIDRLWYRPRNIIMIIGRQEGYDLKEKMDFDPLLFDIKQTISIDQGLETILDMLESFHEVIISDVKAVQRNIIIKRCYQKGIRVFITPKISDIIIRKAENIHLFDTPLLMIKGHALNIEQRIIKRTMDIVLSLLAIIGLIPLWIVIVLAIKIFDSGPIFYTQDRLTYQGKVFKILKFRSMTVNAESNQAQLATTTDQRITKVGQWLRTTHFDELPQLLNILVGDMSIIGPRPERPDFASNFTQWIPEFDLRLKVKAGLTGYAQVYGQYNTTPYDKLKLDLYYIQNFSFWLDINIILFTVKILFKKDKSLGFDQQTLDELQKKGQENLHQQEDYYD